jgi:capsular polysaccharide biosynthesis protein
MEIQQIWNMLRRRWWLIALPVVVAAVLVVPTLSLPAPSYSVVMRFTAAASAEESTTTYEDSAYIPWLASEYVVINLPQWVTSDTFAVEVSQVLADDHNLSITPEDVRSAFAADAARSILFVYITWDDPDEIRALAEAAETVLQTRNQDYFPQFASEPAAIIPLDNIRVNEVAPSLMARLSPLIRLVFALAAGIALAVAVEYFDTTIRTTQDIEAMDVPVIARVPKH